MTMRWGLLVIALLPGCVTARVSAAGGPSQTVDAWRAAAAGHDAEMGRELIVPGSGLWPEAPSEPAAAGPGSAPAATELRSEARWHLDRGRVLVVERSGGAALIASGVLGLTRASEPLEAAVLFARAWRQRDFGLMLSLLPAEERPSWTADLLAQALDTPERAAALTRLCDEIGSGERTLSWLEDERKAWLRMPHGDLLAVEEEDGWKVGDLRLRPDAETPP
ncbi:MAG: hypothetical protein H6744_04540 [Deltaproteobacteria bacterium]|nr:hypothetical protein [Deltaproteobacteria bacterium]MCB9785943.1 hypothetical protein [Deltaproteobacteria bacterium]